MFTVKVVRVNRDGDSKMSIYECRSFDIIQKFEDDGPIKRIVCNTTSDESMFIGFQNDFPDDNKSMIVHEVIIENQSGKTSEIIRNPNRMKYLGKSE